MSNLQVIDQIVLWNHDSFEFDPIDRSNSSFLVLIAEFLPILGSQLKQPMQGEKLSYNGNDTILLSQPIMLFRVEVLSRMS